MTLPAGTDKTIIISEEGSYTFTLADFGFSDLDGHSFAAVQVNSSAAGQLFFDPDGAGPLPASAFSVPRLFSAFDIADGKVSFRPVLNGNGTPYASFTFQVQDSNNELDASPNTITFNVTSVNDAPVMQA